MRTNQIEIAQGDDVRELELELTRIRAEARAARLEARAAEIELLLRRSVRNQTVPTSQTAQTNEIGLMVQSPGRLTAEGAGLEVAGLETDAKFSGLIGAREAAVPAEIPGQFDSVRPTAERKLQSAGLRITSWEELMQAAEILVAEEPVKAESIEPAVSAASQSRVAEQSPQVFEVAGASEAVAVKAESKPQASTAAPSIAVEPTKLLATEKASPRSSPLLPATKQPRLPLDFGKLENESEGEGEAKKSRKQRPAAWIFSVLAHAAVLLILAGVTLSTPSPKDQFALSAATAQPSEEQVETVELEQMEQPESETSESSEALATVSPIGDIASAVVEVTGPGVPDVVNNPGESLGQLLSASVASGAPTDVSTTFFGASGGGNHFVYVVDSSRSMDDVSRDGFDVARAEVLRAVESLNDKQRFYVIFFGEETFRMRLTNPNEPEPRSVNATAGNKQALRRWASTIEMQAGKWPEESLEFAFTLRPDCIFLLTDGAMPDYVTDFVKRNNIVDTLLDGPKPRSIIHTIGFHNTDGEAILSKIAKDNGGKYHFVPAANVRPRR